MNAVHYRLESDIIYTFCGIQHKTHTVTAENVIAVPCLLLLFLFAPSPKPKMRNTEIVLLHIICNRKELHLSYLCLRSYFILVCVCVYVAQCLNLDIYVHIFSRSQRRTYF